MYGKNAEIGEEVLGLHMLSKNGEPMVGFSAELKDEYSEKLRNAGYTVLIEQVFELNLPQHEIEKIVENVNENHTELISDVDDISEITLEYKSDAENIEEIRDVALSIGAIVTVSNSDGSISIQTYENQVPEQDFPILPCDFH